MPRTTAPSPLFTTHLQPAQRAWQHIPRGAEIVVLRGSICLHQRQLLAESWMPVAVQLQAGERYRVDGGGWLELEARGTATLAVWAAADRWAGVWRSLGLFWGGCTAFLNTHSPSPSPRRRGEP